MPLKIWSKIRMYYDNDNTPVSIVTVSMGGVVSLHFLRNIVNQAWKDKFIANFIPLGSPWSGSPYQVQSMIKFGQQFYGIDIAPYARTWQSTAWLLPRASFTKDAVLVETPSRQYTANDYKQFFNDLEFPQGYDMFLGSDEIRYQWPGPNVTTYCVYGSNVSTPVKFIYSKDFPEIAEPTEIIYGSGDDSVVKEGGELCLQWKNGYYPVHAYEVPNVDHVTLVSNHDGVLRGVASIVDPPMVPATRVYN